MYREVTKECRFRMLVRTDTFPFLEYSGIRLVLKSILSNQAVIVQFISVIASIVVSSLILYWSSKLIILLHIGYKFVWIYHSIEFGSSFAFHDNMPLIHQYNFSLWLLGPVALLFSFEMTWTHFHRIWLFYIN
jgi:hypothetical protein